MCYLHLKILGSRGQVEMSNVKAQMSNECQITNSIINLAFGFDLKFGFFHLDFEILNPVRLRWIESLNPLTQAQEPILPSLCQAVLRVYPAHGHELLHDIRPLFCYPRELLRVCPANTPVDGIEVKRSVQGFLNQTG